MRLVDTRPPFAGLANLSEGALASLPTPCYLLDEAQLRRNGEILLGVQQRTGCKILLAQKAFSNFDLYPLLAPYLAGTEASGLYESRLGKEELPEKENHVFCAAYRVDEFNELLDYADHIVFNSPAQLAKFGPAAKAAGKSVGLRINPERSTQEGHAIYDPCAPGSRLGTTRAQWDAALAKQPGLAALLDGLHFHTLCEQDADALAVTLDAVEEKFGDLLPGLKWLNFGGGHHITRPGYDLATLEACIARMQEKYGVQVYLEPGEAWALNAGYLVTTVLDTLQNGDTSLAVLDMSAACHTPDVIEMPYRPPLLDAGEPGEKPCTIRLGGPTCLAGDVVGDYSFDAPLAEGDRVMQVRNNYDIVWEREGGDETGTGVFNGDVGELERIYPQQECLIVRFDDRLATYTFDMLSELELAYAVTVHKSQGSEFDAVVFALSDGLPRRLLTRNILYTGITRAKQLLVIVGSTETVSHMVANNQKGRRYSALKARLRGERAADAPEIALL